MRRCGKIPFTGLEDHVQLIEENAKLKESNNIKDQEIEKLKSPETATILDESKFQELNNQNQKHQELLKVQREKIDELEQRDRQCQQ